MTAVPGLDGRLHDLLDFCVIGLELIVTDGPIGDVGTLDRPEFRSQVEVLGFEPVKKPLMRLEEPPTQLPFQKSQLES